MPDLYLILDFVVVAALIILGVTVLFQNTSVVLNRVFAWFVLCISVWIVANYISNDIDYSVRTAVIANYFVFSFSYGASITLLQFGIGLAGDIQFQRWFKRLSIPMVVIGLSSATPLVVSGAHLQDNLYAVEFGPLAPLYFLTLIANIIAVVYVVRRNIKRTHGDQRGRLKVLFRSLCWTFPVLLLAQAVVPALTGWFGLTNIGVLPMLILVFGIYYGVVKHRLFDLRLIVVRSIAYALTLGFISACYVVVTHFIISSLTASSNQLVRDVANSLLIIIVAVTYTPIKISFNKLTNKIFYRDAYDPQLFFNEFNETLVVNAELDRLLNASTGLVAATLKSEFCSAIIIDDKMQPRLFGDNRQGINPKIWKAGHHLTILEGEVIVTDTLASEHEGLKTLLLKSDIAIVARLTSGHEKEDFGYLVLGPKRSGNAYNSQDLRIIETVANELIIATQNAMRFEQIKQFNVTLQEKIDVATHQLRRTNEKLRKLDETKDDFISMASHQLRTPLTSVKGYVSMVLDGDAGKITPLQRKLLTQSFISSQRMVYLISDLLNVSRLRTGKFIIEPVVTNLATVIQEEVEQLIETAKGRNLALSFNKPSHFPDLMLDETKIRQVIMNFIDNAVYYTPSGGHIVVNLVEKPKTVEFTVVDDGIGVPRYEQHHLFSKFFRAPNAKRARPDGTGLGLFMAKKVIIAQGGAIVFKSQEGRGSTFGFTFAKDKLTPEAYRSAQAASPGN